MCIRGLVDICGGWKGRLSRSEKGFGVGVFVCCQVRQRLFSELERLFSVSFRVVSK